jgi:hypothetical protein
MRSIVVLTGAVLLVGLAAAGASGTSAKQSVTLRLVEKSVGFNFVDNPPRQGFNAPPLMGDQFAITSEMQRAPALAPASSMRRARSRRAARTAPASAPGSSPSRVA